MIKNSRKKVTVAVASLAALGLVAGAFAVFTSNFDVKNKFKVEQHGAQFVETFTPPLAGDEVLGNKYDKSGTVDNTASDVDVRARVKITAGWYTDPDDLTTAAATNKFGAANDKDAATLVFGTNEILNGFGTGSDNYAVSGGNPSAALATAWSYDTDGYFYYGGKTAGVIAKNSKSNPLLKEVSFETPGLADKVKSNGYVYVDNDGNDVKDTGKKYFATQEAATAAAVKAGVTTVKIKYIEQENYVVNKFNGLTYVVRLEGQIISADTTWDKVTVTTP